MSAVLHHAPAIQPNRDSEVLSYFFVLSEFLLAWNFGTIYCLVRV